MRAKDVGEGDLGNRTEKVTVSFLRALSLFLLPSLSPLSLCLSLLLSPSSLLFSPLQRPQLVMVDVVVSRVFDPQPKPLVFAVNAEVPMEIRSDHRRHTEDLVCKRKGEKEEREREISREGGRDRRKKGAREERGGKRERERE